MKNWNDAVEVPQVDKCWPAREWTEVPVDDKQDEKGVDVDADPEWKGEPEKKERDWLSSLSPKFACLGLVGAVSFGVRVADGDVAQVVVGRSVLMPASVEVANVVEVGVVVDVTSDVLVSSVVGSSVVTVPVSDVLEVGVVPGVSVLGDVQVTTRVEVPVVQASGVVGVGVVGVA